MFTCTHIDTSNASIGCNSPYTLQHAKMIIQEYTIFLIKKKIELKFCLHNNTPRMMCTDLGCSIRSMYSYWFVVLVGLQKFLFVDER